MRKGITILFITLLSTIFFACTNTGSGNMENSTSIAEDTQLSKGQSTIEDGVSAKNILQIAMGSDAHTTLVAGVKATGLEDVLANNGPLTVFAPTNAAFDKLPAGTLETLLLPENLHTLKSIIIYHAAPGTYKGKLLKDGQKLFVATGDYLLVERTGDEVKVNGSKILATIEASNGVIHIVDDVFLPN